MFEDVHIFWYYFTNLSTFFIILFLIIGSVCSSVIMMWYVSIVVPFLLTLLITTSESANKLIAKCLLRSKLIAFTFRIDESQCNGAAEKWHTSHVHANKSPAHTHIELSVYTQTVHITATFNFPLTSTHQVKSSLMCLWCLYWSLAACIHTHTHTPSLTS